MRADMGKVLVERGRSGSRTRHHRKKGYSRTLARDIAAERELPREGILALRGNSTHFGEHLGPLRRFLNAHVGRRWNTVYAELCEHIDRGNVVQKHILTHLFDYVETDARLVGGVVCFPAHRRHWSGRGSLAIVGRNRWFVCPKTGILKRAKSESNAERRARYEGRRQRKADRAAVWVGKWELCRHRDDGGWELVTVEAFPAPQPGQQMSGYDSAKDAIYGTIRRNEVKAMYGREVVAVEVRRLTAAEVKQYPIPIDLLRRKLTAPNVVR